MSLPTNGVNTSSTIIVTVTVNDSCSCETFLSNCDSRRENRVVWKENSSRKRFEFGEGMVVGLKQ